MMIRPIFPTEAARLNTFVAYEMMEPPVPLEEFSAGWAARETASLRSQ